MNADIITTQRYAHLLPGRKEAVISDAVAGLTSDAVAKSNMAKRKA